MVGTEDHLHLWCHRCHQLGGGELGFRQFDTRRWGADHGSSTMFVLFIELMFFFFDIIFILLYLLSLPRTILNGEIIFEYILILHSSSHVEVMEHHSNIVPWQYLGCTGVMAIWMSWNTKRISSKAGNTKNWSETEVGWHHWRGAGRIGGKHLWISIYITQWLSISLCVKTKNGTLARPRSSKVVQGKLDVEEFKRLLTPKTKLVAFVHISNTLGCINPVTRHIASHRTCQWKENDMLRSNEEHLKVYESIESIVLWVFQVLWVFLSLIGSFDLIECEITGQRDGRGCACGGSQGGSRDLDGRSC